MSRPPDFAAVESPHRGAELLRKLMDIARSRGHVRRYFSLRRAWILALGEQQIKNKGAE